MLLLLKSKCSRYMKGNTGDVQVYNNDGECRLKYYLKMTFQEKSCKLHSMMLCTIKSIKQTLSHTPFILLKLIFRSALHIFHTTLQTIWSDKNIAQDLNISRHFL